MFVTPLKFEQVLDRFYSQQEYDLMLLFVSSFDKNDSIIIRDIVDNAKRIDRITGSRICFFYFIEDTFDSRNEASEKLVRWVKNIPNYQSLYGEGVSVTMNTADDICKYLGLLRSHLPAFILISRNKQQDIPQLLSIQDCQDLEIFLTPLNILHSYLEDRDYLISNYEHERRKSIVSQEEVVKREEKRKSWIVAIQNLERKKAKEVSLGLSEQVEKRNNEILFLQHKLEDNPELQFHGIDENVIFPQEELDLIRRKASEKLNLALNSHDGDSLVSQLETAYSYSDVILKIWERVRSRDVRLSRILENIRHEIFERGFDVFISCKSQDYALAHELHDYLIANGYSPFLADTSIKEVGIDQYTLLIGEVINVCQNMIVFATDARYLESPYVSAEWHTFINDINTGHKPNAKLVNILSPEIDVHALPIWLRDKQCCTTENYKDELLYYLRGILDGDYNRVKFAIKELHHGLKEKMYLFCSSHECPNYVKQKANILMQRADDKLCLLEKRLERVKNVQSKREFDYICGEVESRLNKIAEVFLIEIRELEAFAEEEYMWDMVDKSGSLEAVQNYLTSYPLGIHQQEAKIIISSLQERSEAASYVPKQLASHSERNIIEKEVTKKVIVKKCIPRFFSWWMPLGVFGVFGRFGYKTESVTEYVKEEIIDVYSSIFAPAEVKRKSHMLVQVYLHLLEETEEVKILAQESQKNAERRDYIPLQCKLKNGDKVDVQLNIYGETLVMSEKKSLVWKGSFTKCSFDYFVPKDIDMGELSCITMLTVNGIQIGEMRFITQIVEQPSNLCPEVFARQYKKIFISYAHQDESKVKYLAEAYKAQGTNYFFDRHYLKGGDVFPLKIQEYINTADLFILCWSENASKSKYVKKELTQALELAFPKVQPLEKAKLSIYPMSIEPRAELPHNMKNTYNFEEV